MSSLTPGSDRHEVAAATPRAGLPTPNGEGGFETKGADALVVRGLLYELPAVGSVWSDERRQAWTDAMLAAFAVLYEEGDSE